MTMSDTPETATSAFEITFTVDQPSSPRREQRKLAALMDPHELDDAGLYNRYDSDQSWKGRRHEAIDPVVVVGADRLRFARAPDLLHRLIRSGGQRDEPRPHRPRGRVFVRVVAECTDVPPRDDPDEERNPRREVDPGRRERGGAQQRKSARCRRLPRADLTDRNDTSMELLTDAITLIASLRSQPSSLDRRRRSRRVRAADVEIQAIGRRRVVAGAFVPRLRTPRRANGRSCRARCEIAAGWSGTSAPLRSCT